MLDAMADFMVHNTLDDGLRDPFQPSLPGIDPWIASLCIMDSINLPD